MDVIGFGTYDRAKHPRVGILLDGLADCGDQVHELNAPLGFSTAERVAMLAKPWLAYRFGARLLRCWSRLIRARCAELGGSRPDAVLVGYLGHFDVMLARLLYPRSVVVLDLLIFGADTATDRGVRTGPKLRLLALLDRLAMGCADLVLVDTEEHAALMPASQRDKAVVVSVGCPTEWFRKPPAYRPDRPLRVVFYGLFTPLQGTPVIGQALARLEPGTPVEITMIGSGQDLAETRSMAGAAGNGLPAVRWLDWVPAAELPELVAEHDVCLGIFGTTAKGLRVTPNKVYQGAAAGCVIVTSDTSAQRRSLGAAGVYVAPGDPKGLAETLRYLAMSPEDVARLRAAAYAQADEYFRPFQVVRPLRAALQSGPKKKRAR